MDQVSESGTSPVWLGDEGSATTGMPGGDGLWVGKHSGDDDLLVFDPSEADPRADVISFYSLAKHRTRSFPRSLVGEKINPADEVSSARALKDYARRATLQAERDGEREADRSAHAEQQREAVIEAHQRYVESLGLEYEGVERTDGNRKSGRRTKCASCGIPLDDFAHAACSACSGVLCSCGACLCGATVKGR